MLWNRKNFAEISSIKVYFTVRTFFFFILIILCWHRLVAIDVFKPSDLLAQSASLWFLETRSCCQDQSPAAGVVYLHHSFFLPLPLPLRSPSLLTVRQHWRELFLQRLLNIRPEHEICCLNCPVKFSYYHQMLFMLYLLWFMEDSFELCLYYCLILNIIIVRLSIAKIFCDFRHLEPQCFLLPKPAGNTE